MGCFLHDLRVTMLRGYEDVRMYDGEYDDV